MADDQSLHDRLTRVETLLAQVEQSADPAVLARTREIVQGVLDLHAAGLERVLEIVGPAADTLARDDLVGSLLLLYGLNPLRLKERVRLALDKALPSVRKLGGDVELMDVREDGTVRLRVRGGNHGCHSSFEALRPAIEEAIQARAPDLTALEIEDATPPPAGAFVPVQDLVLRTDRVAVDINP